MNERKLRLFAVAYCRQFWSKIKRWEVRKAVQVAEQFADGLVSLQEMVEMHEKLTKFTTINMFEIDVMSSCLRDIKVACQYVLTNDIIQTLSRAIQDEIAKDLEAKPIFNRECGVCKGEGQFPIYGPVRYSMCQSCGVTLETRSDIGNQRSGHLPKWCPRCWAGYLPEHIGYGYCQSCWKFSETAVRLAEDAYWNSRQRCATCKGEGYIYKGSMNCDDCHGSGQNESGKLHVGILADALEEERCDLHQHFRQSSNHYRGCWVIDLIRGIR